MDLSGLIPLQKAYTEAAGVRKRLSALHEQLGITVTQSGFDASIAKLTELEGQLKELKAALKDRQTLVDDIGAKIKDREDRLVRTNVVKEIQGLQGTLKSLRKQQDDVEEEALTLEEQATQKEQAVTEEQLKAEELKSKLEGLQAESATQSAALEAKCQELEARVNGLRAGLDREIVEEFDRQVARRNGVAVSFVQSGTCSECGMLMAAAPMQRVRKGLLVHCQNCRRILLLDEAERSADRAREQALRERGKARGRRPSNRENEISLLQLMSRVSESLRDAYWELHHWMERLDQFGIEWYFQTPEGLPPITRFRSSLMQRVRRGRVFAVVAVVLPDSISVFIPHHLPALEERHPGLVAKYHLAFHKDAWNGEEGHGAVVLKVGSPDYPAALADIRTILKIAAYEALKPT